MPPWNIAVFTWPDGAGYAPLRNALLYGDHVHWVAIDSAVAIHRCAEEVAALAFSKNIGDMESQTLAESVVEIAAKSLPKNPDYKRFHAEYRISGAAQVVTQHNGPDASLEIVKLFRNSTSLGADALQEAVSRFLKESESAMQSAIKDSRVLANPYPQYSVHALQDSEYWNAYQAAHEIANSLSRLLLPDVSTLSLEAIVELRDHLSPVLSTMRGELLRFTETLRVLVGDSHDAAKLAAEADNLVATKVEPVVREADYQARKLLDAKWRKLLTGAAKAFGFAGASFVDPKMLAKAVQQTLETGALALSEPERTTGQARATSQFVLEARSFLADRAS